MGKKLEQIIGQIHRLMEQGGNVIVAIDGNCTAGKTTLAGELEMRYDCNVIHMDDFFLRPSQRTAERLAQPGGNVDYERFREEVLEKLRLGEPFSYRPYDCSTGQLTEPVPVEPKQLTIVEGTYSQHPYFGDAYDLRLFLHISEQLQAERVRKRPAFLHKRFFTEWIPMEQQYFRSFRVPENSHLVSNLNEEPETK